MTGLMTGKTGFVTGAASGIGRGIAKVLAAEGATVVVSDLEASRTDAEALVAEITAAGGKAQFLAADVSSAEDITALVDWTKAITGTLDFAVNNAGIGPKGTIEESDDALWDKANDINLKSVFRSLRATIAIMRQQGHGSIVNISSVAGVTGLPTAGVYSATKHAVIGLTKTAAAENGDFGIRVNAILPNAIKSKLMEGISEEFLQSILAPQAIHRLGEPEEVGHAAAFLLSDKAAFITGVSLPIDGGFLATN